MMSRIVQSTSAQKLHDKVLALASSVLSHHRLVTLEVVVPTLLASRDQAVLNAALEMLCASASIKVATSSTMKGLLKCLDFSRDVKGLQAVQEFISIISGSESVILELKDGEAFLCPLIFSRLATLLESSDERLASLALRSFEIGVRAIHYSPLSSEVIR